ncbi:hypothetical protein C4D60_Mb06t10920 [Musa balbisiana]|uniref:PHD-type zinc finger plants domain-containing protein n=1 Tax=Musa balbisiana TaxID=52838 RepID=A0A4S8IMW7_MUSBA|nr:hypothetical protein C4D60_Mb06t10920 [Musa balbisiana]
MFFIVSYLRPSQSLSCFLSSPPPGSEMASLGGGESPPATVCCMCGDHGLLQELFQCKVCLVRSQHRYCSDLYPKNESYRACNWCLRDGGAKGLAGDAKRSTSSCNAMDGRSSGSTGTGVKVHRQASPSQLSKPIKKLRLLLHRSASDITDRMRSEELSPSFGRGRQVAKGKIRRYKLLEEVSS